ncbi:hypothetical protein [Naasia aerilata]|uniref:Uncharacterized protein n=1 Tax=Naasia aerilata TaxID=1162966 RepID=A0ABM8GFU3_9MICO|nr:hypothetical protein [Naasia aerilata]BDZ47221.1 hypothetical protein GCM10025866_31300 [Naasia aerilata]
MTADVPAVHPDYAPLTAPVTRAEIEEFRRRSKAAGAPGRGDPIRPGRAPAPRPPAA